MSQYFLPVRSNPLADLWLFHAVPDKPDMEPFFNDHQRALDDHGDYGGGGGV